MDSYYSKEELQGLNFKSIGEDVCISRRAVFYRTDCIEIGSRVRIDDFCFISGGKGIRIGNCVHIATFCALYGKFGIEIGDDVNLSSRVTVYSTSDDYSGEWMTGPIAEEAHIHDIGRKIVIERLSIIGAGSVLLPGSIIREGVAVGAMSMVKTELLPWQMYAGIPARRIKERSRKMLQYVEDGHGGDGQADDS